MPDRKPPGSFGGGPLLPRWLRALFAWRTVLEAGAYAYQENRVTGARRAVRVIAGGHCPVDTHWTDGEGYPRPDAPPASRGSIFPHFDVNAPMGVKPRIRVPYRREPGPPPLSRPISGSPFGDGEPGREAGFGAVLDRASPGGEAIVS